MIPGQRAEPAPLVLKFGGAAFTELAGYQRVAGHAARRLAEEDRPLVLVVSAMSGTTGRLQQSLDAVAADPPARAAAMLLTTGETVSAALLAAALDAAGLPARALSAAQTGLLAAGPADRARLERVDAAVLRAALAGRRVLVVPGGQAVDVQGRTVMLGRNSSDLSAVAVAAALGAPVCELFSDVPGVCTADPYLVPAARTLARIGYQGVRRMSRHGAKVIHESAVDWAEQAGVRLHCRPFPWAARPGTGVDAGAGTLVGQGPAAAAVVVHQGSEVWRFRSGERRLAAAELLLADGLRTTEVDAASGRYLVVPGGARGAARALGAARRYGELCLITTLGADGGAEQVLVRRADAAAEARRYHAALYPEPEPGSESEPAPGAVATVPLGPVKARSAQSDVLLAADPRPRPA
ncbi:aspartate kinase [Kitasatospora sp. NPDC008050]|uniref:amino acid kinase family protein n=1 Tax=Kitasatospora sp. NPDC008050 TaxID=3364021 RepID=UPI0036E7339E